MDHRYPNYYPSPTAPGQTGQVGGQSQFVQPPSSATSTSSSSPAPVEQMYYPQQPSSNPHYPNYPPHPNQPPAQNYNNYQPQVTYPPVNYPVSQPANATSSHQFHNGPLNPQNQQSQQNYQNNYYNNYNQQPNQVYPQLNVQQHNLYPNIPNSHGHGHGQQQQQYGQAGAQSVTHHGFNQLWGTAAIDLLKTKQLVASEQETFVTAPTVSFPQEWMNHVNCSEDIFRCTLTKIPETKQLLQKSRLPLGILIHPFKDLNQLPVIQCTTIVRCRGCRTYINPYVYFVDQRRWKCNLCWRVNDLPEEFQYDPLTKTYGDPSRRPEVKAATIEFLAPADYMVRPPQASIYVLIFDVTSAAVDSGYLKTACDVILDQLDNIPGDSRTQMAFIAFDEVVRFFRFAPDGNGVEELVVPDVDDMFLPSPDNLLVNLKSSSSRIQSIRNLLQQLPRRFLESSTFYSTGHSALGAALNIAQKLLAPLGGRITVFTYSLPTSGPGALLPRSASASHPTGQQVSAKQSQQPMSKAEQKAVASHLNPSSDFYKKLALDCSTQYIAVDVFVMGPRYVDIASVGCVSRFSGGQVQHFEELTSDLETHGRFESALTRYLTRKIGFEAVMRVRCTRGLSIHTFHGNLFVRSTDLLSLPNINPDAGFGMQVSIDEDLKDFQQVAFQAALLYTSSKGERRIRVHTLCLPVVGNVNDVIQGVDSPCVIGLLAKMAVDRVLASSLDDAREAIHNAVIDAITSYTRTQHGNVSQVGALQVPPSLKLLPILVHALLRSPALTLGNVPLDIRANWLHGIFKTSPLYALVQTIYPDLYDVRNIWRVQSSKTQNHVKSSNPKTSEAKPSGQVNGTGTPSSDPDDLNLSELNLDSSGETNNDEEDEANEEDETEEIDEESAVMLKKACPKLQLGSDRLDAQGVYVLDLPTKLIVYIQRSVSLEFLQEVLMVDNFMKIPDSQRPQPVEFPTMAGSNGNSCLRRFLQVLQNQKPFNVPCYLIREDSVHRNSFISQLVEDRGPHSSSYYEFLQHVQQAVAKNVQNGN